MPADEKEMSTFQYLKRKLHNFTHPKLGCILMLHRVVKQRSEGDSRKLEVTPWFLEQTIKDYQKQGYRFVSIEEVYNIILSRKRPKEPFVCFTFDDGYQDTFSLAYPILKQHNVPFAVYVTTGFIDKTAQMWWYEQADVMDWEQVKILDNDPLCTICVHTITHPRLSTLTEDSAHKEITSSKRRLEEVLGHPIQHFSYPHGDYNTTTIQLVKETNFKSSLMAWGGPIRRGANLLLLPRIELRQL